MKVALSTHVWSLLGSLTLALVCLACGDGSNESVAKITATSTDPVRSADENTLGLTQSAGSYEHWDFSNGWGPLIYQPNNYDRAMSSFVRLKFDASGQMCSGVRVYEQRKDGKFDMYVLTAAHCLASVSPNGLIQKGKIDDTHSFDVFSYSKANRCAYCRGGISEQPFKICARDSLGKTCSRLKFSVMSDINAYETVKTSRVTGVRPQQAGNSDAVRFLLSTGQSGHSNALPLCSAGQLDTASNKQFSNTSTSVRLMLGYNSPERRVILQRMNGSHNLKDRISGTFSTPQKIVDFLFATQNWDKNSVRFYGYTSTFGIGVEASDSGLPILFGTQEPPHTLFRNKTHLKFENETEETAKSGNWRVNSIDCVSGIVTREFAEFPIHIEKDAGRLQKLEVLNGVDVMTLGRSKSAFIQELNSGLLWTQK
jgi:hypothetical protein